MKRIERLRNMSVTELADAILKSGFDEKIDFCDSNHSCGELEDIPEEMCRKCLIEWLMKEENE